MRLPKSISPCPIEEAVLEIRFDSKFPSEAIFGMVYNIFKEDYSNLQKLPVLQIPESIRLTDPKFTYTPHYKLHKGNFILLIGPKVLGLSIVKNYTTWDFFKVEIISVLNKIYNLELITNTSRIGMRYLNFFNFDIFKKINFKMLLLGEEITSVKNTIKLDLLKNGVNQTIQLVNNTIFNFNNTPKTGSVLDIDSFINDCNSISLENIMLLLDKLHDSEKELFFSFITEDFLNKELNPKY